MLDRNRRIKERPERFQDSPEQFDVVISLEERVYDQIMEGMIQFILICFSVNSIFIKTLAFILV